MKTTKRPKLFHGRLNREILKQGWHQFQEFLNYKSEWYGSEIFLVPPQYTSQTCSSCFFVSKENRKTQRKFQCQKCGIRLDADYNASRIVRIRGQRMNALGGTKVASAYEEGTSKAV